VSASARLRNHDGDTYSLGFAHAPQLDQTVVTGRDDQGHGWVEGDPVDTPVVALENELDDGIGVAKHVGLVGVGTGDLVLEAHGCGGRVLLAQAGDYRNVSDLRHDIKMGRWAG